MYSHIWIWGISAAGKLVYRYASDNGICVDGIIDNNEAYRGLNYSYTPIYIFAEASSYLKPDDIIVICVRKEAFFKVNEFLRNKGFSKIIWMYDFIDFDAYTNRLTEKVIDCDGVSKICDSNDFLDQDFDYFFKMLKSMPKANGNHIIYHRKTWEWCYISAILKKEGKLCCGTKGIGFAVGTEPLPALFAGMGSYILATDLNCDAEIAKLWQRNNENTGSDVANLFYESLCSKDDFDKKVKYKDVDMNCIPEFIEDEGYDYCWSSCAIEHLGSIENSKTFLKNMTKCLKHGGIGIHTTEFNLSSEEDTIEYGGNIIWRKKDIEEIQRELHQVGCEMNVSYQRANTKINSYIDMPPYEGEALPYHMNLVIDGYASTSIALVVKKE